VPTSWFTGDPAPMPERPRLLFAGHLQPWKGLDLLLRALPRVAAEHPGVHLVVAGDGPYRQAYAALAQELGVADRVEFAGAVPHDQVRSLMQSSMVVVVPSREEAQSLVALEAGATRRPVVAARVGGLPEIVQDGLTGWLFEPEDVAGLTDRLERVLHDREEARLSGERGYLIVRERFTWRRCAERYATLFEEVVYGSACGAHS
jgi:glycosyltransferase involved in cell wall biosynthesis